MKIINGLPMQQAIIRAAVATFVELGYDKASMDEVATRASTTKRTVYAHFSNKEQLFRCALEKAVDLFHSELPKLLDVANPVPELAAFAIAFSDLSTWKGAVRLQQVVLGDAERFPDMGAMLHREIIERTEAIIAAYLAAVDGRNNANLHPDTRYAEAASLFLNLTTGRQRFATLFAVRQPFPTHPLAKAPPDIDHASIRYAVSVFLKGTGIGSWEA